MGRIPTTVFRIGLTPSALTASFILAGQVAGGEAGRILARVLAPTADAVA